MVSVSYGLLSLSPIAGPNPFPSSPFLRQPPPFLVPPTSYELITTSNT